MKPMNVSYLRCTLCVSVFLLVCGLFLLLIWPLILKHILQRKLVLSPDSELFGPWKETPFSVPLDFYLFNWTNPHEIYNDSVKPKLQQIGPFRYLEDYRKSDITWNDNGTVTFRHLKFWKYSDEKGNGDLHENVTIINPVLVAAAHALRTWNYLVRRGFSFSLSSLKSNISLTHTVEELIFNGVEEPLLQTANTMSFLTGKLPYDKFGFFYKRNGSSEIDGVFNMGTGINSTLGAIHSWNYMTQTPFFSGKCSKMSGSAGDFFQVDKEVSFYVPHLCRNIVLKNVGTKEVKGILGYKYILEDLTLDNGTIYPENKCYCNDACIPSGVMNISSCNHDSPMFVSLPHFYRADPYYGNLVEGLNPTEKEHEFFIILDPTTGFTLEADAKLQVNVLLQPDPAITRLKLWKYRDEEGNSNLEDNITTINPIALTTAHLSRTWNYFVRKGLSLTLSNLAPDLSITHTANEMLFEGYPDTLIKIANTFPFFAGKKLPPWDKFGWFYARNDSSDFEGVFTVGTGKNSTFGKLYKWNHWTKTPYFEGKCGEVDGFFGDFLEPCQNKPFIGIFSSDVCRKVVLEYAGKSRVADLIGNKYVAGAYMFDNGTLFPENRCFCGEECLPSGVLNVSSCRYGSPSFGSLPHFYKADSYYRNLIEGMKPEDKKHDFFIIVEPNSGIPLEACVRIQLNLLLQPIHGISMYENVPRVFFPMLWFEQKFRIPDKEAAFLQLVLKIPFICFSLGIFITVLGLTLLIYIFHQRCSVSRFINKKDQHLYRHECVALNSEHEESVKEN